MIDSNCPICGLPMAHSRTPTAQKQVCRFAFRLG